MASEPSSAAAFGESRKIHRPRRPMVPRYVTPPTTIVLDIGCAVAGSGAPEGDRSEGIELYSLHLITPETATTTHYFWVYARNFATNDGTLTEQLRTTAQATFLEDLPSSRPNRAALIAVRTNR